MDSERLGLEFSLIWARFCLYFRMDRAWLLQTITRWTICISCCTHHGIVALTLHFLADIWCGGLRIAPGIDPKCLPKQGPKKIRIFTTFSWKKSKIMKRSTLILSPWAMFRELLGKIVFQASTVFFALKNYQKTCQKPCPNHEKNDEKKHVVF